VITYICRESTNKNSVCYQCPIFRNLSRWYWSTRRCQW